MHRFVARALPGTLLFRTQDEARRLWRILVRTFPEAIAICLMPNHVHLDLPHDDPSGKLARAMAAFARARNALRGSHGPVWEAHPPPEVPSGPEHARRALRYTLLNPCRARLVGDPLAWPWSTHRDVLGLALEPHGEPAREPEAFHRWVSADGTVNVAGTPLPRTRFADTTWPEVVDAVCAVTRAFPDELGVRGPERTLALRTAWAHGLHDVALLARHVGCTERAVQKTVRGTPGRGAVFADPALAACVRVVGDERFYALGSGDLRRAWWRTKYARMA